MSFSFFATCPRGLEQVLVDELANLHATKIVRADGGVRFEGSMDLLYRVNLSSRIATRILFLVKDGFYKKEEDLYKAASCVDWDQWFDINQTIKVSTSAIYAPLKSLDFVTLRIKDAVCDFFRKKTNKRPSVASRDPDIKIHLFLNKNQYSLYLDASGAPLYQRGYRVSSVQAPIRENLAAGIIALSGWKPGAALLDPMCGSGTFLIEAALIAKNKAPGLDRMFSFMAWKNFNSQLFNQIKKEYVEQVKPSCFMNIYGSDRELSAIRISKKNLALAGLDECIKLSCSDFNELKAPAGEGVMITNPPYGERIGENQSLNLEYPTWASQLKSNFTGWRTYFLTSDLGMPKLMRLSPSKKTPLFNGALDCRLFEITIVAGSNRKKPT
ncbi:MAG: N-6 DNA methylase [Methylophilaceae bacterium]|nr:N-6 DNA methylase [Methylophilaceae bacterium]MBL6726445.1 N-6 DNA methylase [Methylophilaceae bacterium]MBL6728609.1 N-6 DNA methylase [Methylophilaceae bacterium]MBL6791316.1 N-6 DNA methylase [Methylophilaceae bacterium]